MVALRETERIKLAFQYHAQSPKVQAEYDEALKVHGLSVRLLALHSKRLQRFVRDGRYSPLAAIPGLDGMAIIHMRHGAEVKQADLLFYGPSEQALIYLQGFDDGLSYLQQRSDAVNDLVSRTASQKTRNGRPVGWTNSDRHRSIGERYMVAIHPDTSYGYIVRLRGSTYWLIEIDLPLGTALSMYTAECRKGWESRRR